jgi:hypothetical protein
MDDVLPIGASWPRPFQRVTILFGPAVDYSHLVGEERSKETAQAVVDLVMSLIRYQHDWIRRYRAGEVGRDSPPWVEPGYARLLEASREAARLAPGGREAESPSSRKDEGSRERPESDTD